MFCELLFLTGCIKLFMVSKRYNLHYIIFVFSAFDLAVALMELEEVCELVTDSRYAYGKAGKYVVFVCFFVFLLCNSDM